MGTWPARRAPRKAATKRFFASSSLYLSSDFLFIGAAMTDETGPENKYPVDVTTVFYATVGQGISFWASMEGTLVQIAAKLLGTSEEKCGLLLYSIMNLFSWLTIIDELF